MPSGGPRTGTPGKHYANRSDLRDNAQPIRAAKGQVYGERKAQEDAQKIIPLPQRRQGPPPGSITSLTAPTERPDEPLTAGLSLGEGPGPDSLIMQGGDDSLAILKQLYAANPFEDLRRLIERAEGGAYM